MFTVAEVIEYGRVVVPTDTDACWMWNRGKTRYGKMRGDRAHRQMYRAHYGVEPGGMDVCHRCDRPGCVNPEHLFLGTRSDNISDAVAKGRVVSPMLRDDVRARVSQSLPHGEKHYTNAIPGRGWRQVEHMMLARLRAGTLTAKTAEKWSYLLKEEG